MASLKRLRSSTALEAGEWFVFKTIAPETPGGKEEVVRVKLRGIPDTVSLNLEVKWLGREQAVIFQKNRREMHVDPVKFRNLTLDKCMYAFLDTENYDVGIGDEYALEQLKGVFPNSKIGDVVRMDGKWTDPLKHYILFDEDAEFRTWCREKFEKIDKVAADDEEGKG